MTVRRIAGAVVVLLVLAAGAAVLKVRHDGQVRQRRAEERRQRDIDAEVVRQRAISKRQSDITARAEQVRGLEAAITKDALQAVNDGVLTGPIDHTTCTLVGGGDVDQLAMRTGRFECLAINKFNQDGTQAGYRYSATVNYQTGQSTWHLGG